MQARNKPWYKHAPISSLAALARHLGLSVDAVDAARAAIPSSYRRQEQPKRDGGVRITYFVEKRLKAIQGRILHRLLRRIDLPDYLLGGRPGRDYLDNAQWHCGANILFGEDVTSFYPSIRAWHVRSIFQNLMRFAPEVAECLTDLCTYEGAVPQGARTSGDLANLVLWRSEPDLVLRFAERGFRYSRFVDDIYVSAQRRVAPDEKTWMVSQLYRLLRLEGFSAKRKKHELSSSGDAMRVHRVSINAGRPSIAAVERAKMRFAVRQIEKSWWDLKPTDAAVAVSQLRGRIARLKRLHPMQYERLASRLSTVVHLVERANSAS
jgi:hypothetical protein